ncbi:MAG: hypothetical protein LBV17_04330 [Treponema sp.]|jgi:hypothetical protein|nr:hypothetical protein [Treponema sp.]
MDFLLAFIGIGIGFIVRAIFIAQKIKKDPETKKYGNNPQKTISITAITGAILFAAGCIGLPVLEALKPSIYTFENKSSFAVNIFPEFGDNLQVQSGTIKSFESSHKDMAISYTPSEYVEVKKINTRHWEFSNGNYYLEANRGFLIYPPESWEITNYPGLKYKIFVGQTDNNFAPNINFDETDNPFSQFITFINFISKHLEEGSKVIGRSKFDTNNGLKGYKIETNTEKLLQIYYIFDLGQTAFTICCSAPLQSQIDYDVIFDESVKTLAFVF